ncbi:MAG: hypothetical protein U0744_08735 [Gemmataceae bacterium]
MQFVELQSVAPIKRGRGAREAEPVLPVDPNVVQKTLEELPPHIHDMVLFQLRTGARPGEVCAMRPCDIERTQEIWIYRPSSHKTAHHGHVRAIAVGPKAQAALLRHLDAVTAQEYVFSPARQDAEIKAAKRAARKTPVQPSQLYRSKRGAVRKPKAKFGPTAYARAIARACKKAGAAH